MASSRAHLRPMDDNGEGSGELTRLEKGRIIRSRWVAADIKSVNEFAELSGIHRDTVKKMLEGTASDNTYERASAWLDRYVGEPKGSTERLVTFKAKGIYGIGEVTVEGPREDGDELEERFARIVDRLIAGQRDKSAEEGDAP